MYSIACTLAEGDYGIGAGVLVNSLVASGFSGSVWIACSGALPAWAGGAVKKADYSELDITPSVKLKFFLLETSSHYKYKKPAFVKMALARETQPVDFVTFFDADVIVTCPWLYIEQWLANGVAACEDSASPIHSTHPMRAYWKQACESNGLVWRNDRDIYINSGFLGMTPATTSFLDEWQKTIDMVTEILPDKDQRKLDIPHVFIRLPDQDSLNMAFCCTAFQVSFCNKDAMDFVPGGYVMSHATGKIKPWHGSFFLRALRGHPPRKSDKEYIRFTRGPIKILNDLEYAIGKFDIMAASLLGRCYKRS